MDAQIISFNEQVVSLYMSDFGNVEIYENGGEVNVTFSKAPGLEQPLLPKGLEVAQFRFTFSVPYERANKPEEFASRLLFVLNSAASGVDILDYFARNSDATNPR